jgi:hypothetical protein
MATSRGSTRRLAQPGSGVIIHVKQFVGRFLILAMGIMVGIVCGKLYHVLFQHWNF